MRAGEVTSIELVEEAIALIGRDGKVINSVCIPDFDYGATNNPWDYDRMALAEAIGDDVLSPNWNMDFLPALTRVLAATCVGLAIRAVDGL
ncbi:MULTISPECIES: hypothetical protein [Mycobacteroides]|nr:MULTISPECIES: hypothetical protein [Mycobacteroides]MBF9316645.1 hypothetical protein [Mycobacteroides chelonae]